MKLDFRNKFAKETIWSFLAQASAGILFIVLNVFLARTLGVERFGTWSYFFSVITILMLFSYSGITASSRKFIAQYSGTEFQGDVLRSTIKLCVILSFVFAALFLLLHRPLASILGRSDLRPLFLVAAPLFLFVGITEYLKKVFGGLHRLKFHFIVNTLEYGLKLLFTWIFLSFTVSTVNVVYSFNVALLITSTAGLYMLWDCFYRRSSFSDKKFTKKIIKYSVPLFFVSIGFMVATELDTIMIGLLSTDTEVGIYAVAKQIVIKIPHIAMALALGTMPVFAKLDNGNKKRLRTFFHKLLRYNVFLFGAIVLGILLLSWRIVPLLFGAEYVTSALVLVLLTPYLVSCSFSVFLSSFLDYQGRAKKRAYNIVVTIILNIFLNLLLIPRYGAPGAAVATSLSYLPYLFLNWLEVKRTFKEVGG